MAKKIMAVVFGFILAPAFITAQTGIGSSLAGTVCMVPVYHTNFAFPPEGGRIVKIGNEMFFWKTYLPECINMLPANTPVMVTSFSGTQRDPYQLGGTQGTNLISDPCAVPVYHTQFNFPSEGGKVVKHGNEMYFIKNYLPGCESAGAGLPVVATSNTATAAYQQVQPAVATPVSNNNYQFGSVPVNNVQTQARPSCY